MTKFPIPLAALSQHIAVLGKTGSGKSSTARLIVERIVAAGHRACILDPTKSDWWGITSSATGNEPGCPFRILGGPHGHVALHSSAGRVIGKLVAEGDLPLSILDMADFEPGGLQRFFSDFAPALLKHVKGVLYLVIEEAHEFAPKERAGFGAETMAIHWAKKLATAGRSKGIRMIVVTQRTQSLHNAVLGSCETMITHRLTAPADQAPLLSWLKANVSDKTTREAIEGSMSSLPTGTAWVVSGEERFFERVRFPKFSTYDNTATPDGDTSRVAVRTATVDHDELRALIGDAVKEAEANDPKKLKATIDELRRDLAKAAATAPAPVDPRAIETADRLGYDRGQAEGYKAGHRDGVQASLDALHRLHAETPNHPVYGSPSIHPKLREAPPPRPRAPVGAGAGVKLPKAERAILTALAQHGRCDKGRLALMTGYAAGGGGFNNALSALNAAGRITRLGDVVDITETGLGDLGAWEPLPTGAALLAYWMAHPQLGKAERAALQAITDNPAGLSKEDAASLAGYEATGGGFNNALSRLRTLGLIIGSKHIAPAEALV